jgi:hypothetical protein
MTIFDELTLEYLQSIDWELPIQDASPNICEYFWSKFFQAAKMAEEQESPKEQIIFTLLGRASSLFLKADEKNSPFGPMASFGNKRTADIADFSLEEIEVLKLLVGILKQNDLKARLSDVIWVAQRKDNFRFAEQAIDFYLRSAEEQIFAPTYTYGVERLTRALHLAASLGRRSDRFGSVARKIEELIGPFLPHHDTPVSDLIKLLLEYGLGDFQKLAKSAESCAVNAEVNKNWYVAGHYWEIKAKVHRLAKEVDQEYKALHMLVNTYVEIAEISLSQTNGFSVAAHHLQSAIEVLRRIPDTKELQDKLHGRMLYYQKKSTEELGHITSETIDLTEHVENAIAAVKGKSFMEAVFSLALFTKPVSRKSIAELVDEMAAQSPLSSLLTSNMINSDGKVVGKRSSMLAGTAEQLEEAKEAEMFHWASFEQSMIGKVVDYARQYLLTEHNPSIQDIFEIVRNNPFVPPGRELIFARGLLSGLNGDLLSAIHLLVPQLENSIRYILNGGGIITSSLSPDGIQEEFELNKLLDMPETTRVFHEDLLFGLRGTLTSRFGRNFRNLLAHGLLDYDHFLSYDAVYIWWLVLKICCMPIINQKESKNTSVQ